MEIAADLLILFGATLIFIATIGCEKFPSFFTRLHAAAVGDTTGLLFVIAGVIVKFGFTMLALKSFFLLIFVLITGSTACHSLIKSAYITHGEEGPPNANKEWEIKNGSK